MARVRRPCIRRSARPRTLRSQRSGNKCRSQRKKVVLCRSSEYARRRNRRGAGKRDYINCARSEFRIPLIVPRSLLDVKFDTYIKRIQRKVKPKLGIKKTSLALMDNLMKDTLHQLACHASSKMGRRKTLKPKMIVRALRKVMPKSLVDRVHEHAQNVLDRYSRNLRRKK